MGVCLVVEGVLFLADVKAAHEDQEFGRLAWMLFRRQVARVSSALERQAARVETLVSRQTKRRGGVPRRPDELQMSKKHDSCSSDETDDEIGQRLIIRKHDDVLREGCGAASAIGGAGDVPDELYVLLCGEQAEQERHHISREVEGVLVS